MECKICYGCGKRCRVTVKASPIITGTQISICLLTEKEILKTMIEYMNYSIYF